MRCRPIQVKQKSRGVTTASLDFLVSIAQVVHNLLMPCDSPFLRFDGKGTPSFFTKIQAIELINLTSMVATSARDAPAVGLTYMLAPFLTPEMMPEATAH